MKYDVEMAYGIGFTVSNIEADSKDEAVIAAKKLIKNEVTVLDGRNIDAGDLEFDAVNYVSEPK